MSRRRIDGDYRGDIFGQPNDYGTSSNRSGREVSSSYPRGDQREIPHVSGYTTTPSYGRGSTASGYGQRSIPLSPAGRTSSGVRPASDPFTATDGFGRFHSDRGRDGLGGGVSADVSSYRSNRSSDPYGAPAALGVGIGLPHFTEGTSHLEGEREPTYPNLGVSRNPSSMLVSPYDGLMEARPTRRAFSSAAKVPEPRGGKAMNPPSTPIEPPMPIPRSSRRFVSADQKRVPNLCDGDLNVRNLRDDEHVVSCEECGRLLKVQKSAVLVKCPNCSKVGPAWSTTSNQLQIPSGKQRM